MGLTESKQTDGNIAQGMLGSALLSTLNLSTGIQNFFSSSTHKISYGDTRLEPLMFQDDLGRLCRTANEAQAANDKIEQVMNLKQLQVNIDKSSYLLIGPRKRVHEIRELIKENPLTINGKETKESKEIKYLGEHIHKEGLDKTIEETIKRQYWIALSVIMEIKTIVCDFRNQKKEDWTQAYSYGMWQ